MRHIFWSFSVLVFLVFSIQAGTIKFEDTELLDDETLQLKIGLVTEESAIIGDDHTFLSISQSFSVEKPTVGLIEVLIYHSDRASSLGYKSGDTILYCCTQTLYNEGKCDQPGRVITNNDKHIQAIEAQFTFENPEPIISKRYDNVTASGMYYIKYFNCPGQNLNVKINGVVSWKNPFGELSAELYPFLWFFAAMTVAYLILGLIWMVLVAWHWKEILPLQNCISVVIFLGMVECVTWYHDFHSYNDSGNFVWGAILVGVLTSTLKRTLSRLLVLVVAMGYGVVKANLGTNTQKVVSLGVLYFIVSFVQQLIVTYLREGENELLNFLATVVILPAAILDTIFYWWIFLSMMRTIQQLKVRKQEVKLQMYTRLLVVLAIGGIFTVLVILYQTLLVITSTEDVMWRTWWMFQAFWHLLYFTILVAIAFLWRPTKNNTRYAYVAAEDIELALQSTPKKKGDIEAGEEIHLDLDRFGTSFLEDSDEHREEVSKMQ